MSELNNLYLKIKDCQKCSLFSTRENLVFGEGNENSDLMFIGEAPGAKEDLSGKPFVGAAGKLLNQLLEEIGLKREEIYIANIIKSRPPKNRDPLPQEIEACKPYLIEQIRIIKPKIIVPLGAHSARTIIEKNVKISEVHGRIVREKNYIIFPIYHPAAAMYRRSMLPTLQEDFQKLKMLLGKVNK